MQFSFFFFFALPAIVVKPFESMIKRFFFFQRHSVSFSFTSQNHREWMRPTVCVCVCTWHRRITGFETITSIETIFTRGKSFFFLISVVAKAGDCVVAMRKRAFLSLCPSLNWIFSATWNTEMWILCKRRKTRGRKKFEAKRQKVHWQARVVKCTIAKNISHWQASTAETQAIIKHYRSLSFRFVLFSNVISVVARELLSHDIDNAF